MTIEFNRWPTQGQIAHIQQGSTGLVIRTVEGMFQSAKSSCESGEWKICSAWQPMSPEDVASLAQNTHRDLREMRLVAKEAAAEITALERLCRLLMGQSPDEGTTLDLLGIKRAGPDEECCRSTCGFKTCVLADGHQGMHCSNSGSMWP